MTDGSTLVSVNSPSISNPPNKRPKIPPSIRKAQVLALHASGLSQSEIAKQFGVDRSTISNDLKDLQPAKHDLESRLSKLVGGIDKLLPIEERAAEYAALATTAKNEAVRLGTLQRIDDLDGIVTEKELVRSKRNEPASPQALFMLPPGTSISFSATTVQRDTKTVDVSASDIDTSTIDNNI